MGFMVPQPYAVVGNRSYLGVLGHNRRPKVITARAEVVEELAVEF
jgi:hypothetical protein